MGFQVNKINDRLSVAPQLKASELPALKAQGFKTIINNRPDNEEIGQPCSVALSEAAKKLGFAYFELPVVSGLITDNQIEQFDNIVETQNGPILAFCRTGTRCAMLWALSEADNATTASILKLANRAGYDLSSLKPRIEKRRAMTTAHEP